MTQLSISKVFPAHHPRKGENTNFKEKILAGTKIHTVRGKYNYWKRVIDKVKAGKAVLDLVQWSGKPYCSPREEPFLTFDKDSSIEVLEFQKDARGVWAVGDEYKNITPDLFALADGFNDTVEGVRDFYNWIKWKRGVEFNGCLIYFTEFRY